MILLGKFAELYHQSIWESHSYNWTEKHATSFGLRAALFCEIPEKQRAINMCSPEYVIDTDFESPFYYFVDALRVLSHDPKTQCREKGSYNAPWEIQHQVINRGELILQSPLSYLTREQKIKIGELTELLKRLPEGAISPDNVVTTTYPACLKAMEHPAWEPMRNQARQLLTALEWAIKCNDAALGDSPPT